MAHVVVDSASLAVQRRYGRAQTEGLDGPKRRTMRLRQAAGAKQGWRGVHVPSVMEAARRQRHRARLTTQRAWTRVIKRSKGLLAGCGMRMGLPGEVETQRDAVRQWDGAPLPAAWRARLKREWQQGQQRTAQSGSLEAERRAELRTSAERVLEQGRP